MSDTVRHFKGTAAKKRRALRRNMIKECAFILVSGMFLGMVLGYIVRLYAG